MFKLKDFKISTKTLILTAVAAVAIIGLSAILLPFVLALKEPENQQRFSEFVKSLGGWGPILLLIIQMLQVFVAFIPGEPIEIIAGLMYGTWGGLALCLGGILISTVIIYFGVRKIGKNKLSSIYEKEENAKYSFIFKSKNLLYVVFILFLIPGTPKDILLYLCPFTKINPLTYFAIATFARIPSIITSTLAGDTLAEGSIWTSVIIFGATAILGLAGITLNKIFMDKQNKTEK